MQKTDIDFERLLNDRQCIDLIFNFRQSYLFEPFPYINYTEFIQKYDEKIIWLPSVDIKIVVDENLQIDWHLLTIDRGKNSAILWLHSLSMVYYLCKLSKTNTNEKYIVDAIQIYQNWRSWSKLTANNKALTFEQEHAVSNRLAVFLFLNDVIIENEVLVESLFKRELLQDMLEHIEWLSNNDYYIKNNHGLMMDMSLLAGVNKFSQCSNMNRYEEIAISRALELFQFQFDKDGCCTENSPEYHILNIELYKVFIKMSHSFNINSEILEHLNYGLLKAEDVSSYMIRDDGKTSPIGDTEVQCYTGINHVNGAVCYSESGFGIVKNKDYYFTIKCGGMSFVHKHVDDTSITYRYKGLDIIVDGGRFSYDTTDRRRRDAMSFRSHSGFFSNDFEGYLFKNFSIDDLQTKTDLSLVKFSNNVFKFSAKNSMINNLDLRRNISVFDKGLQIEDIGNSNIEKIWYSQFLLHPDTRVIEVRDSNVYCSISDVDFVITHNSSNAFDVVVEKRLYSESFMQAQDCNIIIFKSKSQFIRSVININLL